MDCNANCQYTNRRNALTDSTEGERGEGTDATLGIISKDLSLRRYWGLRRI